MIKWDDLVKLEPALLELEKKIREGRPNDHHKWYSLYRPVLVKLVGHYRYKVEYGILDTSEAYEAAYRYLHNIVNEDLQD